MRHRLSNLLALGTGALLVALAIIFGLVQSM